MNMLDTVLEAVARSTDPTQQLTISERRELLLSAIAKVVEADVWLWFSGEFDPHTPGDSMPTQFIHGGFKNGVEQADFFRVIIHPDLTSLVMAPISMSLTAKVEVAARRCELISDESWAANPLSGIWSSVGFDDFIIFATFTGDTSYSAVGFHRRLGRPRFSIAELNLTRSVFANVDWLHRLVQPVEASPLVMQLSPRERQVLLFLLEGDSRKQVAKKTRLSEHTVADHTKKIYKKFEVSSRAELLAKFIQGKSAE